MELRIDERRFCIRTSDSFCYTATTSRSRSCKPSWKRFSPIREVSFRVRLGCMLIVLCAGLLTNVGMVVANAAYDTNTTNIEVNT